MFKLANKRSRTHAVRRKSLAAELSVSPGFCSPGFQRKACCLSTPKLGAGVVAATGTGVCAVRVSDTILLGAERAVAVAAHLKLSGIYLNYLPLFRVQNILLHAFPV